MSVTRRDLVRYSFATRMLRGKARDVLIRRNGPRHYIVRDAALPDIAGFFDHKFRLLRDALRWAETVAGGGVSDED